MATTSPQATSEHTDEQAQQRQASVSASASAPATATAEEDSPERYELANVHSVYSSIAPHFSSTRHKPWPLITRFLLSLPAGSLGLDVGCGNGKYLPVNRSLHILASDRSPELLSLARDPPVPVPVPVPATATAAAAHYDDDDEAGAEGKGGKTRKFTPSQLVVADTLNLPYRPSSVDFIISIAVIHHLSTRPRRVASIVEMLRCLRPGGDSEGGGGGGGGGGSGARCLLYVWALEQTADSRRAWNRDSEQDTLVPWVLRQKGVPQDRQPTFQRYYHLYREGELEEDVLAAGGTVLESGYEKDNWWVICARAD